MKTLVTLCWLGVAAIGVALAYRAWGADGAAFALLLVAMATAALITLVYSIVALVWWAWRDLGGKERESGSR